jgi:nicotinate-nucleotide--dimethylbenzimidazole phosphoribosyltransferase
MSIRLAGITGQLHNPMEKRRIVVLAADNGVVEEGVSATPQSVTLSQSINMTMRKTGMSCLAKFFGDDVVVTDVGIASDYNCPGIRNRKIRYGTANLAKEPAMTRQECLDAIWVGLELAREAKEDGIALVGVGEMGIGNTTTSSAVLAVLTGSSAEDVTGRGGGLTDSAFDKKKRVIASAIQLHHPDPSDPVDVLAKVGGLDLAAMAGVFLGCARYRIPVVVDGFISIVAAVCAAHLCRASVDFMFLSHISYEIGYQIAQKDLGLPAYLDMGMRLGEGSGCPLAFQLLRAAGAVMDTMATFEEAAINDDYLEEIRTQDAFVVKK